MQRFNGWHIGENLAACFLKIVELYSIIDKIGYFTLDNASNNDTALHDIAQHLKHQQKITLRQIRRRCVLTHVTLNLRPLRPVRPELRPLRPLRPVRPELRPLRPVRPELRPLHPLRPVRPELLGNARSNSMRPEFPRNAGSHPMPPGPRCELLCVRMGGCLIAAS